MTLAAASRRVNFRTSGKTLSYVSQPRLAGSKNATLATQE